MRRLAFLQSVMAPLAIVGGSWSRVVRTPSPPAFAVILNWRRGRVSQSAARTLKLCTFMGNEPGCDNDCGDSDDHLLDRINMAFPYKSSLTV